MSQPTLQLGVEFLKWLQEYPDEMARFLDVLKEFIEMQDDIDIPVSTPEGPVYLRPGEKPGMTTIPITREQLDALMRGEAEAQVKEDAINFIKGFLFAVSLGFGPISGVGNSEPVVGAVRDTGPARS